MEKVGSHLVVADQSHKLRQKKITDRPRELRWFNTGEPVAVGPYKLQDPMVYISNGSHREDEVSCINLQLELGQNSPAPRISLKTQLSYALLSPTQRANYLRWLSHGRFGALDDIGFAYLFFCGLERRLLMDRQDQVRVLEEVTRLLDTYPASGLFDAHLNLFLAFSLARLGVESIDERLFSTVFENQRLKWDESTLTLLKWEENLLAVALARFYKKRIPLPATWAMRSCSKGSPISKQHRVDASGR